MIFRLLALIQSPAVYAGTYSGPPPSSPSILMGDGSSFILMGDGSKILLGA